MQLLVLGSSAGGGFPQWNGHCSQCSAVRAGSPTHRARTQSSIAVGGPDDWLLVNASPDLLTRLQRSPGLNPARPQSALSASVAAKNHKPHAGA